MPQYLRIAERIYKKVSEKRPFTGDMLEDLNLLMIELREEVKGTELKLIFKYIDFQELSVNPVKNTQIKIDLSLIPKISNREEFILWLAGFIEKITIGGKKKYPPIDLKKEFKSACSDIKKRTEIENKNALEIMSYFETLK